MANDPMVRGLSGQFPDPRFVQSKTTRRTGDAERDRWAALNETLGPLNPRLSAALARLDETRQALLSGVQGLHQTGPTLAGPTLAGPTRAGSPGPAIVNSGLAGGPAGRTGSHLIPPAAPAPATPAFADYLGQARTPGATAPSAVLAKPFGHLIAEAAARHGVDPALVAAVVDAESSFNPNAVSGAGAKGLMQLMDATARGLGVQNPFDPVQNIEGGTKFLAGLLKQFNGDVRLALAGYNAGPGAVQKYGGIPPYAETQRYVPKVIARWQELQ